jgi:exportin-1
MRILETTQENIAALLMGLEYLIGISYVDDTEVFKVGMLKYFCHRNML